MTGLADIWRGFAPGDRIYIAGLCGEPTGMLDALQADPELGGGLQFTGAWIPGVNRRDPTAGVPEATAQVFFVTPELREGFAAGRVRHMPQHYSQIHRWLSGPASLKAAILQVTPPQDGFVTPGLAFDFTASVLECGANLIGEINEQMPTPPNALKIPVEKFAALIDAENPLPNYEVGALPSEFEKIAGQIAELIHPGDTVQVGLGKVAEAVVQSLCSARDLGYHAGMVSDAILPCLDNEVFSRGITTNAALGTRTLYDRVATETAIQFKPVAHTHTQATLAAIPNLKAINSALEVDLLGQVNGEMVAGRQISGHGGVVDFQRGARASVGGKAILALPATARRGTQSRIKVRLDAGTVTSVARGDADIVVTEHGIADLRWLGMDARAEALIAIAAPEWRDRLANGWAALRRGM